MTSQLVQKSKRNKTIYFQEKVNGKLEDKINSITDTCSKPYFKHILKKLATESVTNAAIICDYITAEQIEFNIKNSTKEGKIKTLVWLSNFFNNKISYRQMSKQNIIEYLNSGRRSLEQDKSQRWIGSYNNRHMILLKFFKWLYNSGEIDSRRETPKCIKVYSVISV